MVAMLGAVGHDATQRSQSVWLLHLASPRQVAGDQG